MCEDYIDNPQHFGCMDTTSPLKQECINLKMRMSLSFLDATPYEVYVEYDSSGWDRWPDELREFPEDLIRTFRSATVIYDFDVSRSDGYVQGYCETNKRFERNLKKLYVDFFPFWSFKWFAKDYRKKAETYRRILGALVYSARANHGWFKWDASGERNKA
jgi:hypothetical protein